jgi:hypothetical protein
MLRDILSQYLKSFPHHKHLKNKVEESDEPLILDVIKEAKLLAQ